jgi:uncharacterized protein YjbI with pentapeptide repeats
VGGIYALERIARDSPPDRATIEEVLTAYVRDHVPWPLPPAPPSLQAIATRLVTFTQRRRSAQQGRSADPPPRPAADVQAAITVLGRRELPPDGLRRLDLTHVDLRYSFLRGANLQGAILDGANLQSADAIGVDLQGANLVGADLQDAGLYGANLHGAILAAANLHGARLPSADLHGANLGGADLHGANLDGADLQNADLEGAHATEFTRWPDGWTPETAKDRGVRIRYLD